MPLVQLLAQHRFGAADPGERTDAVGVAAHDGHFGSGIDQSAGRAACCASVADDEHRGFGGPDVPAQRYKNRFGICVGAAPFSGLAPNRINRADAAGHRVHGVQVSNHFLLVRNGDAETGDGHLVG